MQLIIHLFLRIFSDPSILFGLKFLGALLLKASNAFEIRKLNRKYFAGNTAAGKPKYGY